MDIFKDDWAHKVLKGDLETVEIAFNDASTPLAIKGLETVIDSITEHIVLNLTEEAALAVKEISDHHPDSYTIDLIDFLVFKNDAKVESAKEFNTRMAEEVVDEDFCAQVRVYTDDLFIEVHDSDVLGVHHVLTVENRSWSEPETSLEAMELELFNFAKSSNGGN